MSTETNTRKKRNSSANPPTEGDHRKRRRNRTTQSCLNCHTSKRMCDRKRPACARCTQLGLTGLCVYEVDDPNQRPESQDESARLLKRVAELEGVIRELKNKPHPRWSQSTVQNPGKEFNKWHSRSQVTADSDTADQSDASSPPSSVVSLDKGDPLYNSHPSTRSSSVVNVYPPILTGSRPSSSHSPYYSSSPQSTPSPSIMTPTEEYPQPQVVVASQPDLSQDYDLASAFLGYAGLAGSDDGNFGLLRLNQADEACFIKQHGGHCGCLLEPASYNVVLELSIRLRKAADILARSTSHHIGSNCPLNQRISDLDSFATNALGNIISPPDELASTERPRPISQPSHFYNSRTSPKNKTSTSSLRSWDMMPASCDDSFMTWEPPRRS
ncbi:hypothetical protein BDZ94DRAFT_1351055 [Collybia nuda]|uniref:Zn(2)-C6 fungal-type domain-containing protein n=1 Tax=Collybia nuda TaxID=64659 RepID=A0A9P6CGH5_9AGAR|nr:hypothetical protein BDZ94DRAFT_1351055 [Collybia nuda]